MNTITAEILANTSAVESLNILMEGNNRFVNNLKYNRNFLSQIEETKNGQHPHAIVLSCMDSRTPIEHIFDQGIGDIFSIRIAGHIVTDEVIGSLEYACKLVGTKLILVLGHSKCGAITGACQHKKLGKLTGVLAKITPALVTVQQRLQSTDHSETELISEVTKEHIIQSVQALTRQSDVLKTLLEQDRIGIVGAHYDVSSGKVEILSQKFI
ncbi:carbonic anhydrase [Flavobacterium sp. JP2137]|uniref:carbonic anhydrase n=1 Tax=Flavobacterium sp. JP2137 TaxID=3414510 RepID=UPI003D2FFC18